MLAYQLATMIVLFAFLSLVLRNLRDYQRPTKFLSKGPLVSVCLPVRNEQNNIEECLAGLLTQEYKNFEIVVLDDCSEDRTAEIVTRISNEDGRVQLFHGKPIASGWAGKCHACAQLAVHAKGEYLLFVDADTRAEPALLGGALAIAMDTKCALVSAFPTQITGTFWEHVVLPMLQFLIVTLLPIHQVWESKTPAMCAACGQFLLFSREGYTKSGGHRAIPGSFHDGLQLARRVKTSGGVVRLFDASQLMRCRMYDGGRAVWNGFTRNAYEGLGSFGALMVMTVLLTGLFLMPFMFMIIGLSTQANWSALCAIQIGIIIFIRSVQAIRFGHWRSVALFPLSVIALIAIQWGSFWQSVFRKNKSWKGREYIG